MAEKYAVATGNWSDPATWDGGVKPVAGDTVHSNNYTVSMDEDATVALITNKVGTTAAAGGKFVVAANNITITADVEAGATDAIENNFGTFNIVGDLYGGTALNAWALNTFASRITNHIGNCYGGASTNSWAHNIVGECNMTGNAFGGSGNQAYGIACGGSLVLTGSAVGGSSGPNRYGVNVTGTAEINEARSNGSSQGVNGTCTIGVIRADNASTFPVSGKIQFFNDPSLVAIHVTQQDTSTLTLTDSTASANYPAENEVESGVVFGNTNQFTGTLQVVDAAQLASDLLDEIQTSSHVVAQRLRAAATDDSVGSIVTSTLGAP